MGRERAVVVTDLREPLSAVHRRRIRGRTVLMAIWIAGWASTGFFWRTGWLAITVLVVTGPLLWLAVWAREATRDLGRRAPVSPRPGGRAGRALPAGPAAPGAAGARR